MIRRLLLASRVTALATAVALGVVAVSGCSGQPAPASTATATVIAPTTTASTPPSPSPPSSPALVPTGTAADNLAYFGAIVGAVAGSADAASGRAYIDALVAAGFDKAAMQVTNDTNTLGDPAESIQFSVLWHDGQCLVGQVGPATGAPVTAVLPAVGDRMCLIGSTRPIDW